MFSTKCSQLDCGEPTYGLERRCQLHTVIATARGLTPERFELVRDVLAKVQPLTDAEREERRVKSALTRIEWNARDLKRAKADARRAGADADQIAGAVRRGKGGA